MKNFWKANNRFLRFSAFRIVLFCGLCAILTFLCLFGPRLTRFYLGEGNSFTYNGGMAVHFLDVGHGDCAVVQLPDGKAAIIDGGEEIYFNRVDTYLQTRIFKGKTGRFDYVINTHPHSDHFGGLVPLIQEYDIEKILLPDESRVTGDLLPDEYNNFLVAAAEGAKSTESITAGIAFGDAPTREQSNYWITFHTPNVGDIFTDFNELSPIVTIEYGVAVFVFTGDAGFAGETSFIKSPSAKSIFGQNGEYAAGLRTYLKAGHHGSDGSNGNYFLKFIRPDISVISVGTRYKTLPNKQAVARLRQNGARVFTTRENGNIVIRVDDGGEKVFLAFDTAPDLTWFWVIAYLVTFIASFVDFRLKGEDAKVPALSITI